MARKAPKRQMIVRVDDPDREQIRKLAEDDGISMAEWVRRLIARSLSQRAA